jgi:hypothetical protein
MDPNTTLMMLRQSVQECLSAREDNHMGDEVTVAALEALDLFDSLDTWLSKGGFPPTAWAPSNPVKE